MNLTALVPAARRAVHPLCDLSVATAYGLADTVELVAAGITGHVGTPSRPAPRIDAAMPMPSRLALTLAALDAIPAAPPPLPPWWPEWDLPAPADPFWFDRPAEPGASS